MGTLVLVGLGIWVGFWIGVGSDICVGAEVGRSDWSVGAIVGAGVLEVEQLAMHNPIAMMKSYLVLILHFSSLNLSIHHCKFPSLFQQPWTKNSF
jgi:hypothetical protein